MDAKKVLFEFKNKFDPLLLEVLVSKKKRVGRLDKRFEIFLEVLEDYIVRGGKRLRPAFMYYGYLACGGKKKDALLRAAGSVELLHAFLLIHDDLIDRSDLRRGKKTAHRLFEGEYGNLKLAGDREHFGKSVAMILGDLTHAFAYEALLEAGFPTKRLVEARRLFDELMMETSYGWYAEMLNTMNKRIDETLVKRAMEYVSARYTISGPLKMGAVLAGASQEVILGLEEYGLKLGTAFQIQDDILGMFGDEEKIGKPVESDMKEGKKTILLARLVKKLGKEDQEKLWRIYGKQTATKTDHDWLKEKFLSNGILTEVKEEAKILAKEALGIIENLNLNLKKEGREFLRGVASYIVEREV